MKLPMTDAQRLHVLAVQASAIAKMVREGRAEKMFVQGPNVTIWKLKRDDEE